MDPLLYLLGSYHQGLVRWEVRWEVRLIRVRTLQKEPYFAAHFYHIAIECLLTIKVKLLWVSSLNT